MILHWLAHKFKYNEGQVETWWNGPLLQVGFRCDGCGEMQGVRTIFRTEKNRSIDDQHDPRGCTCHPDDFPPSPCARKYAFTDCLRAECERLRAELAEVTRERDALRTGKIPPRQLPDE